MTERPRNYTEAGVDIEFLDRLRAIGLEVSRKTKTRYIKEIDGKFLVDDNLAGVDFPNGLWVSETDGIGTQADLALAYDPSIAGWNLIAANTNDVIRTGATPIEAQVDIAIQGVTEQQFEKFMHGVELALLASNCALTAGETAMHHNLTAPGSQAWHMFATARGIVQERRMIKRDHVKKGDVILGLVSSGLHSNGTSLAVKALGEDRLYETLPELDQYRPIDSLLVPTKIYVKSILKLRSGSYELHGLTHVTGGGLLERIPSALPENLAAVIDKSAWPKMPIFDLIANRGNLSEETMYGVFNMGIGFALIVPPEDAKDIKRRLEDGYDKTPEQVYEIGRVEANSGARFVLQ